MPTCRGAEGHYIDWPSPLRDAEGNFPCEVCNEKTMCRSLGCEDPATDVRLGVPVCTYHLLKETAP